MAERRALPTLSGPLTPGERGASRYARGKAKAAAIPASSIPAQGGYRWDERRNTSRVFGVPPDAAPAAIKALAELRRRDPALVTWIEDGAPNLTHDEHFARFGESYKASRTRKAKP